MTLPDSLPPAVAFFGLAPFLRLSIAGESLQPLAEDLLAAAAGEPGNANVWMNLSLAVQCMGQREVGLAMQEQALALARVFELPALQQPAACRVLLLMAPGDIAENTPLDCLLESSDVDLVFSYVTDAGIVPGELPEHDVLMVAMSDSPANRPRLQALAAALEHWPRPLINRPQHIPATERSEASRRLHGLPGVCMPLTWQATRARLHEVAAGEARPEELFPDTPFPIIVRPQGSQAGRDLARVADAAELGAYLESVGAADFFVSRFVDYSGADGRFRKLRIAFIDGRPFVCHMAVSEHWMVHYVNAGMYEDAAKRAEEAAFMTGFAAFAERHREALAAVRERIPLDYFCIDCAETRDGELMIFEADHVMVVHAMDSESLFPYKQQQMRQVEHAFRDWVVRLAGER